MEYLQEQVDKSSAVNKAILFPGWRWYRWKEFLTQHFKPMRGISTFQHFRVNRDKPGEVLAKKTVDDVETSFLLLRDPATRFTADQLPGVFEPEGQSLERQTYIYRNVPQYVRSAAQDTTCPAPVNEE